MFHVRRFRCVRKISKLFDSHRLIDWKMNKRRHSISKSFEINGLNRASELSKFVNNDHYYVDRPYRKFKGWTRILCYPSRFRYRQCISNFWHRYLDFSEAGHNSLAKLEHKHRVFLVHVRAAHRPNVWSQMEERTESPITTIGCSLCCRKPLTIHRSPSFNLVVVDHPWLQHQNQTPKPAGIPICVLDSVLHQQSEHVPWCRLPSNPASAFRLFTKFHFSWKKSSLPRKLVISNAWFLHYESRNRVSA